MAKKVPYSIVSLTGDSVEYPVKNLEQDPLSTSGWQSPRFSRYPQELIICLDGPYHIHKVQILSHHYMISSKIEFFISMCTYQHGDKKLGYVTLSSNEEHSFNSRELKSVHIDAKGQCVRMLIHKNYTNKHNSYNQVGFVALNIIGEPTDMSPAEKHSETKTDSDKIVVPYTDHLQHNSDVSMTDDLAFDAYLHPEISAIIRRFIAKKQQAVVEEDFDVAKKLKQAIVDLHKVGKKLAKLELEKQAAVSKEHYDTAKKIKLQMDEFRLKIYQELQAHGLLEDAGLPTQLPDKENISPLRSIECPPSVSTACGERRNLVTSPPEQRKSLQQIALFRERSNLDQLVDNLDKSDSLFQTIDTTPHDEKVIPALDKLKGFDNDSRLSLSNVDVDEATFSPAAEPEPLSDDNLHDARNVIEVFGIDVVTKAYSKVWSFRESALQEVSTNLHDVPRGLGKEESRNQLRQANVLLSRAMKDQVFAVHKASLTLLGTIFDDYIPKQNLGKADTTHLVDQTFPQLIQKTGEMTSRVRSTTIEFIVKMSTFESVKSLNYIPQKIFSPIKKDAFHRLATSRVEIARGLVKEFGLESSALSVDQVMSFSKTALEHSAGQVREEAVKLIHDTYRSSGEVVKTYLPPDEKQTRKNPLYRNIFEGFDHIDKHLQESPVTKAPPKEKKKVKKSKPTNHHNEAPKQGGKVVHSPPPSTDKNKKKHASFDKASYRLSPLDIKKEIPEKTCIFCLAFDESFTEDNLDLHYWKDCPMLIRCGNCNQVVEISLLSEHLLNECKGKKKYRKCHSCTEAILDQNFTTHIEDSKCEVVKARTEQHCPLCHQNMRKGEDTWKRHHMGSGIDACPANTRRTQMRKTKRDSLPKKKSSLVVDE